MALSTVLFTAMLLFLHSSFSSSTDDLEAMPKSDIDLLEFQLNAEYLEAELFTFSALGVGLDALRPDLTKGGPSPIGGQKANLSPVIRDIFTQFAFIEFGHVRVLQENTPGFPRPLVDLSTAAFATVMNNAFGVPLVPPFDPYANDINFLLACYVIPYVGLTGYVGANSLLQTAKAKRLVAGLLGIESGQDAVIRTLLFERALLKVDPYPFTVAEFTNNISLLRNNLGMGGLKDEGLIVLPVLGAENKIAGNVLAGNQDSLSYARTPQEVLRIVYGSGHENVPGLFFPKGANGNIARSLLV